MRDKDFVLTRGAAALLECSPDNVRYLERTGQLTAVRVSGVRLFRRADVQRLRRERLTRRTRGKAPISDSQERRHAPNGTES
jgi:DNA-binding transcriptional MerR regulator